MIGQIPKFSELLGYLVKSMADGQSQWIQSMIPNVDELRGFAKKHLDIPFAKVNPYAMPRKVDFYDLDATRARNSNKMSGFLAGIVNQLDRNPEDKNLPLTDLLASMVVNYGPEMDRIMEATKFNWKAPMEKLEVELIDLRTAVKIASECFDAAGYEGLNEAIRDRDLDRIIDLWHRRISFAGNVLAEAAAKIPVVENDTPAPAGLG